MDYKYYERKINDVIMKCPIEAGVEILVYNVIDETIDFTKMSLVDINSLWKGKDERLTTEGGISDIAVLPIGFSKDMLLVTDPNKFVSVQVNTGCFRDSYYDNIKHRSVNEAVLTSLDKEF